MREIEREMEDERVQVRITESMTRAFQRHSQFPGGYGIGCLEFKNDENAPHHRAFHARIAAAELLLTPTDAAATLKATDDIIGALLTDLRVLQALRHTLGASLLDDEEVEGTERS